MTFWDEKLVVNNSSTLHLKNNIDIICAKSVFKYISTVSQSVCVCMCVCLPYFEMEKNK